MKEINVNFKIQENEKGRCFLVASSNRSKKILKRELDGETYDALINTRSEKTFAMLGGIWYYTAPREK